MHVRARPLLEDLQRIFGARLQSLVAYGDAGADAEGVHTLALVDRLTFADLTACAPLVADWRRQGLAVPLLMGREEFVRTLDVFPIEWGDIMATHVVIAGRDPFADLRVEAEDLRRACELQAKSHLIHLREGFLESGGTSQAVAHLIAGSAPALRALVLNLDRLAPGSAARAGLSPDLVQEVTTAADATIVDPSPLLARYIDAVEQIWSVVDGWRDDRRRGPA